MTTSKNLEQVIGNMAIPKIDVHDQVMSNISKPVTRWKLKSHKLLFAIIISMLATMGTGFASVTIINLYNEKGDNWLTIRPLNEPRDEHIIDDYLSLIGEGEAIAVYNPENNRNNYVVITVKPVKYEDWALFLEKVKSQYIFSNRLIEHYVFNYGTIVYQVETPYNVNSLAEQSRVSSDGTSYKILPVTDRIDFLTLALAIQEHEYIVNIWGGDHAKDIIFSDEMTNSKVTTFTHHNIEGVVAYSDDKTRLMWRPSEEMGNLLYEIITSNIDAGVEAELMMLLTRLTN